MHEVFLLDESIIREPKAWHVDQLQSLKQLRFNRKVMEEDGYTVYFSNQGIDVKEDPLWNKRRVKGNRKKRRCKAMMPDGRRCDEDTRSPFGVCKNHKKNLLELHPVDWIGFYTPPVELLEHLDDEVRARIVEHKYRLVPMHGWLIERILEWSNGSETKTERVHGFMSSIEETIPGSVPDATTLQELIGKNEVEGLTPRRIAELAVATVNRSFPFDQFRRECVPPCHFRSKPKKDKTNEDGIQLAGVSLSIPNLPLRALAVMLFLAMAAEEANRGDAWFRRTYDLGESKRAGAHFAYTLYVLRREGRMNITQISKLLKIPPWS